MGEVLAGQLKEWQSLDAKTFAERIADYADANGRFQYFAQLHGWFEQINEAKACFNLKSEENRERLSAYDLRTAAYRYCRILGAKPTYLLDNGVELKNGTDLTEGGVHDKLTLRPLLLSACRHGALSQWMSVYYHEDPHEAFEEQYSYERRLEEWVLKLGEIDQNQMYYRRYLNAKKETDSKYKRVVTRWARKLTHPCREQETEMGKKPLGIDGTKMRERIGGKRRIRTEIVSRAGIPIAEVAAPVSGGKELSPETLLAFQQENMAAGDI